MRSRVPRHVFVSFVAPLDLDDVAAFGDFGDSFTTEQAFLQAQQGLEGLSLPAVGDAFWLTFGQMDVPEVCCCGVDVAVDISCLRMETCPCSVSSVPPILSP